MLFFSTRSRGFNANHAIFLSMITKLCGKEDLRETSIPTCRKVEMTLSRYTEDLDLADIFLLLAVKLPSILSAETLVTGNFLPP